MSKAPTKAASFLAAMRQTEAPEPAPPPPPSQEEPVATIHEMPVARTTRPKAKAPPTRAGLKHFGGYPDDETLEKIALLRIRLKMDNTRLLKHAIDELYSRHNAKRAFGDA